MPYCGSEFIRRMGQKAKDGTLRGVWQDWKWIWSFSRHRWGSVTLYTLCGIFSSGLALMAGVLGKYLIDSIIAMDLSRLSIYCLLTIISAVLSVAFQSLTSRFAAKLGINMLTDVQQKIFSDLMHSDWSALSRYPTGELLNRFSSDVSTVANCAVSWLPGMIIQLFTVLATLGVILYYDPVMALIGCASTPILFLTSRGLLKKQRSYNKKMRQVSDDMYTFQSEAFRNVDTLKSFGVEDQAEETLRHRQNAYRETVLKHNSFTIRTNIWLTALGTAVEYAAMGYCLWRLWRGDILFGTMTLFLQQRSNLTNGFSALVSLIPTALSGSVSAERLRELTELPKEPHTQIPQLPDGGCGLELRKLRVGYGEQDVLENVEISVRPGEIVALVGPSGQGKTTLLRMLLGLIRPEEGDALLIDSKGNTHALGADTRSCFTYVPQGNTMIAGTVAENLRLARQDATEQELIAALQDACAWEFVQQLPLGLHAPIGEKGKGLSEGQAQRLAIARALTRNAPIMLLDEVTSALDLDTERLVLENLCRRGVTTVVTTHRPSVLEMCSQVYRVQDGGVHPLAKEEINQILS